MKTKLKIAILMDPIQTIHPKKDTTFRLMLEAQARQYELYYLEYQDLFLHQGQCFAITKQIQVIDAANPWWNFQNAIDMPLTQFDVILMRKDPPVDHHYLHATQLLDKAVAAEVLVVNNPKALRDANEKIYATWFPALMPETLVTASIPKLRAFVAEYKTVVFKPLRGMAGQRVFRCTEADPNLSVILEDLTHYGSDLCMAQRFIPAVDAGDKRILMVNGKPLPYALSRVPQNGDFRGNLARGAKGVGATLSTRDQEICEMVGPDLRQRGILFAGLDVIGGYLTEINITSPTCLREIEHAFNVNLATQVLDGILENLSDRKI